VQRPTGNKNAESFRKCFLIGLLGLIAMNCNALSRRGAFGEEEEGMNGRGRSRRRRRRYYCIK